MMVKPMVDQGKRDVWKRAPGRETNEWEKDEHVEAPTAQVLLFNVQQLVSTSLLRGGTRGRDHGGIGFQKSDVLVDHRGVGIAHF